ncbi:MFS transporter [Pseudomonas coronafaciens]|uniref:MFS transporter n=1 Tax=Pseudomonas coronafaciens TaxID=53409 RepID=UPI000EFF89AA|nr:MFS transporter [Pseudomonas coronafaciens]RMV62090.1 hypothetical protein ALP06_200336 [Pseudomonas coronafaciens pv. atropurpurea]
MDKAWIRKLGYLNNFAKGSESIANQIAYLTIGVLSPLPAYAVSLRVSIGFYLGAFLEIPMGVLADVAGHRKALAYGFAIIAISCAGLLWACLMGHLSYSLWVLSVAAILEAIGTALVSGCFQAYIQCIIDDEVSKMSLESSSSDIKFKALSMSHAYGNFFSAMAPTLIIGGVFVCHIVWGISSLALAVPVVTYTALSLYFFSSRFSRLGARIDKVLPNRSEKWLSYKANLLAFYRGIVKSQPVYRYKLITLFVLMVLSVLMVVHVHTYLMISQLREFDLTQGNYIQGILAFMVLVSFNLAHYIKGWAASLISEQSKPGNVLFLSLGAQAVLALSMLLAYYLGYSILSVLIFVLLFRACFTPGQSVIQSMLLEMVPENLRATVYSLVQVFVLLIYASYSAYLTFNGQGVEPPDAIFFQIFILTVLSASLAVILFLRGHAVKLGYE